MGPLALGAIGLGAGLAGGLLGSSGADAQRRASNQALDNRADFAGQVNDARTGNTGYQFSELGRIQEQQGGVNQQLLQGLNAPGRPNALNDIQTMAQQNAPQKAAMLQSMTPAQQRVTGQLQAQQAPTLQAQQGLAASGMDQIARQMQTQSAMNDFGLAQAAQGRDLTRMQQDASLSEAEINLLDYLNSLNTQQRLQDAQTAGSNRQAAGNLLTGLGGTMLGGAIGKGLF